MCLGSALWCKRGLPARCQRSPRRDRYGPTCPRTTAALTAPGLSRCDRSRIVHLAELRHMRLRNSGRAADRTIIIGRQVAGLLVEDRLADAARRLQQLAMHADGAPRRSVWLCRAKVDEAADISRRKRPSNVVSLAVGCYLVGMQRCSLSTPVAGIGRSADCDGIGGRQLQRRIGNPCRLSQLGNRVYCAAVPSSQTRSLLQCSEWRGNSHSLRFGCRISLVDRNKLCDIFRERRMSGATVYCWKSKQSGVNVS